MRSFLQLHRHECQSLSNGAPEFQLQVKETADSASSSISNCENRKQYNSKFDSACPYVHVYAIFNSHAAIPGSAKYFKAPTATTAYIYRSID